MSDLIDGPQFEAQLVAAAKASFGNLIQQHAGDRFYGFALYTFDDLAGVNPSASTEAGFALSKQKVFADKEQLAWYKQKKIDVERMLLGDYRWSVFSWKHECHMGQAFDPANALVQAAVKRARETADRKAFEQLKGLVLAAMVLALRRLDGEGFFAATQPRDAITLFCSVADSGDAVWLERESARLLNPSAVFKTFEKQRISYIADGDEGSAATVNQFRDVIKRCGLFSDV